MTTHDWILAISVSSCFFWIFGLFCGISIGKRRPRPETRHEVWNDQFNR